MTFWRWRGQEGSAEALLPAGACARQDCARCNRRFQGRYHKADYFQVGLLGAMRLLSRWLGLRMLGPHVAVGVPLRGDWRVACVCVRMGGPLV